MEMFSNSPDVGCAKHAELESIVSFLRDRRVEDGPIAADEAPDRRHLEL